MRRRKLSKAKNPHDPYDERWSFYELADVSRNKWRYVRDFPSLGQAKKYARDNNIIDARIGNRRSGTVYSAAGYEMPDTAADYGLFYTNRDLALPIGITAALITGFVAGRMLK